MNALYAGYRALTALAEPLAPPLVRWRARGESPELRAERLGRAPAPAAAVWWHAASLGEVAALGPVLAEARAAGCSGFAVTVTTATGRKAARDLDPGASLAPLDLPGAVRRTFNGRRPRALVLVETELWPNLLAEARRRGTRLAMVNARIAPRALARYRRAQSLFAPFLGSMDAIAARSEEDAEYLRALGALPPAVRVTGNTKLDALRRAEAAALPFDGGPVATAASVHPGEETVVLAAFDALRRAHPDLRLVLAPRHLHRVPWWVERLAGAGYRTARRTAPDPGDAGAEVLLLDTHGELASVLAASRVAILGGTFVPVGGHNPLEAAVCGVPILFGPYHDQAAEACRMLEEAGGAAGAAGPEEAAAALGSWLGNDAAWEHASRAAREAVRSRQGAARRTVAWLLERGVLLPEGDAEGGR